MYNLCAIELNSREKSIEKSFNFIFILSRYLPKLYILILLTAVPEAGFSHNFFHVFWLSRLGDDRQNVWFFRKTELFEERVLVGVGKIDA